MPRVAAVPLGVLIGASIAACFVKPEPPQGIRSDAQTGDGTTTLDGAVAEVDAEVLPIDCTRYELDGNVIGSCGGWAVHAGGSATLTNGQLILGVPQSANSELATCLKSGMGFGSVTLDIASITLTGQGDSLEFHTVKDAFYYGIRVHPSPDGSTKDITSQCAATDGTTIAWTPSNARYVRIRWTSASQVKVEIGATAVLGFNTIATCAVPASGSSPQIRLALSRGSAGSAMSANFESVAICQ